MDRRCPECGRKSSPSDCYADGHCFICAKNYGRVKKEIDKLELANEALRDKNELLSVIASGFEIDAEARREEVTALQTKVEAERWRFPKKEMPVLLNVQPSQSERVLVEQKTNISEMTGGIGIGHINSSRIWFNDMGDRIEVLRWKPINPSEAKPAECIWKLTVELDGDEFWDSECGQAWCKGEGGLQDNFMNFCNKCGKVIKEHVVEGDKQNEDDA